MFEVLVFCFLSVSFVTTG